MAAINIPVDSKWLRNQIEHSIETLPDFFNWIRSERKGNFRSTLRKFG